MLKIKKIGVVSVGKIMGLVNAAMGLILGLIFSAASLAGAVPKDSPENFAGIFAVIILPVFYGVIGFLAGLFSAWIYNMAARWIGGIEIETETVTVTENAS